ncbi:MAG TPA: hypothetical protein PK095_20360, partial [Myxococcota bacterium]|nr:hypothetical protein [Myxococcota bacterium]
MSSPYRSPAPARSAADLRQGELPLVNTPPGAAARPAGPTVRVGLVIALLLFAACGGGEGAEKATGATGAHASSSPEGSADTAPADGRPKLLAEKIEVLEAAATSLDKALFERSPLLDATLRFRRGDQGRTASGNTPNDPAGSAFEATLRYRVPLESPGARQVLVFTLATNAGGPARVKLDRLEVDGTAASAGGTSSRWEVPVASPDGVAEVILQVSGELPGFDERRRRRALEQELDALPALAQLLPEIPRLEPPEAFGTSEHLIVLAGALPALTGTPPAVFRLEV